MRDNRAILLSFSLVAFLSGCGGGGSTPPPSVSVSLTPSSAQTVDQSRSVNFTSTVVNDTANKGVSWSVSCAGSACGTLTNQTTSSVTYTAPTSVTSNISVKVTATSVTDGTKSTFGSVTVVPPPLITTNSLPGATVGVAYSATLQATNGIAPYAWSVTAGTLTPGLSVNSDGSISGSPTAGGTFNFTVQVADAASPPLTNIANLSITAVVLPLAIATTSLPNGTVDTAYKQQVQVTGGIPPYTLSIANGALPSWATLNSSTGTISGIPGTSGSANFTVQVADSQSPVLTDTQMLTLTVTAGTAANDSLLNGHYAFLFNGFDDTTGSQVAIAGSFTADAKGKITAGIEDENGPSGPKLNISFTATYNIGSDNRGAFTVTTASGSTTYALVLSSISSGIAQKARFIEFDDTTGSNGRRGSGVMRLQDTSAFTQSKITGPYAFGLEGQDEMGNREAMVGAFSADGAGAIPSGMADQNVAGTASNPTLTGTYTAPSSTNGRASMKLVPTSAATLNLSAYIVSATDLLVMTTNTFSSDGIISGMIVSQTSAPFDNNSLNAIAVYYQLGVAPTAPTTLSFAEIGLLSPESGALNVTYDKSLGGAITQDQTFTASYSVLPAGRVTLNGWYGDTTSAPKILYLTDKNKAFFLDMGTTVGFGFVEPQSTPAAGGFSNSSLSGTFPATSVSPSVSAGPNGCGLATLDGLGGFSQIANISSLTVVFVDQTTSGQYSIASNGRGSITNIIVTTASMSASMLVVFMMVSLIFAFRKPQVKTSRPALAMLYCTALIAVTPAGCPPITNKQVFYVVSPKKAVMIHEATFDHTPTITIIEQ